MARKADGHIENLANSCQNEFKNGLDHCAIDAIFSCSSFSPMLDIALRTFPSQYYQKEYAGVFQFKLLFHLSETSLQP